MLFASAKYVAQPGEPSGFSLNRKVDDAEPAASAVANAPLVAGKSIDSVVPVTYMLPSGPTAIAVAVSSALPPKYVE